MSLRDTLAVVMQGPLLPGNVGEIATNARHWRRLLPGRPIVLALSQADPLDTAPGQIDRAHLARLAEPALRPALDAIAAACTTIVLAPRAEPLPPVKRGLGDNHLNLQIAAAAAGLAMVDTRDVLRIRHDLTFADLRFLDWFEGMQALARCSTATLGERVMISPYFTLDPLTIERLPYHFSDWFHLGRTEDVRSLWTAPPMSRADATWYRRHAMPSGTNRREALFHSRLAAEQHLMAHARAALGRPPSLACHNDPSEAEHSLRVLADDFVVADTDVVRLRLDKYAHLAAASDLPLVCLVHADWLALVEAGDTVAPRAVLADKIAAAEALLRHETASARRFRWRSRLRR